MAKKFKVTLHWVPDTPGKQNLVISDARDADEAQERAVSLAGSIFSELKDGHWSISNVESGDVNYVRGDFNGDSYQDLKLDLYSNWEDSGSVASELDNGLVSMDTYDLNVSVGSSVDYTPYGTSTTTSLSQMDIEASGVRSAEPGYKSYVNHVQETVCPEPECSWDEEETDFVDQSEYQAYGTSRYTPYSSPAQPASSSEEEGVTASQAAGYTAYFPGSSSGTASGGTTTKAYYTELVNGYSPYRAFRVSVAKGSKIIV